MAAGLGLGGRLFVTKGKWTHWGLSLSAHALTFVPPPPLAAAAAATAPATTKTTTTTTAAAAAALLLLLLALLIAKLPLRRL